MPVRVEIERPDENAFYLSPKFLAEGTGRVRISGTGNLLHINDPLDAGDAHFDLSGGANVVVGADCSLGRLHVHALAPGVAMEIGSWTSFNGFVQIAAHEAARIIIGSNCLFGSDSAVAASDVHRIVHMRTGARLNPPGDIVVGDHVWIAPRAMILRNSVIGRDSVIGHSAVVKGRFPANVVLAGAPARIVKRRITWEF